MCSDFVLLQTDEFNTAFSLFSLIVFKMRQLVVFTVTENTLASVPSDPWNGTNSGGVHGLLTLLSQPFPQPLLLLDVAKNKMFVLLDTFCLSSLTAGTFSASGNPNQEALTEISS